MLGMYEDFIFSNPIDASNALIEAYKVNNKFLKSKLHMSKIMLPILNFSASKNFLSILEASINNPSVNGNIFSHNVNPILDMCLIYELLHLVSQKFFSLNKLCQ